MAAPLAPPASGAAQAFEAIKSADLSQALHVIDQYGVAVRDGGGYSLLHWATLNKTLAAQLIPHLVRASLPSGFSGAYLPKISKGADVDDNANPQQQTPLHWAAARGNVPVADALISAQPRGADVRKGDSLGYQAIHYAAQNGEVLMMYYLQSKGADLSATDLEGHTPLHWACDQARPDAVIFLVNQGVDVNLPDRAKMTALHWAAARGETAICVYLLDNGANMSLTDKDGNTPFDTGKKANNPHLVRTLRVYVSRMKGGWQWTPKTKERPAGRVVVYLIPWVLQLGLLWAICTLSWVGLLVAAVATLALIRLFVWLQFWKPSVPLIPFAHSWAMILHAWSGCCFYFAPRTPEWIQPYLTTFSAFIIFPICYTLYKAHVTDPGFVPLSKHIVNPSAFILEELRKGRTPKQFCATCLVFRPLRAKHCKECNRCVVRMDHHCPWVGTCVGYRNHRWFMTWLVSVTVGLSHWAVTAVFYLIGHDRLHPVALGLFEQVRVLWTYERYVLLMGIFVVLHIMWLAGLSLQHMHFISRNITTNEQINRRKYDYLQLPKPEGAVVVEDEDEEDDHHGHSHGGGDHGHSHGGERRSSSGGRFRFHNPFDHRSCVANWKEMYHCTPFDYYNVHSVDQIPLQRLQHV